MKLTRAMQSRYYATHLILKLIYLQSIMIKLININVDTDRTMLVLRKISCGKIYGFALHNLENVDAGVT